MRMQVSFLGNINVKSSYNWLLAHPENTIIRDAVHYVRSRRPRLKTVQKYTHYILKNSFMRGQRDADREAEVASLRSRITELERRLSQLEAENAQLRSRDYSLQLA